MHKFYVAIAAMLLLINLAYAQSPSIAINSYGYNTSVCVDALYKLPVTIQGQFNSDNRFSIQIKYEYDNAVIATVPAVLNNGNLEFTLNNAGLFAKYPWIRFKVIASSPAVESAWMGNSINAFVKGSATLSSLAISDTVNIYDNITLLLKGESNSDTRVTLSDSTKLNFSSYNGVFSQNQTYPVTKSGILTIAHAENGCGAMQVSGSVKSVVNSTSLSTTIITPQTVCENGEVKLAFSTQGAPFTAQTKYKIRFIQGNTYGKQASAEVPAQLAGNFLVAKFPPTFVLTYTQDFTAQIITENPSIVGSPSAVQLRVAPQPTAVFTSASQLVNISDYVSLQIAVTGLPPFTVELSNGAKQTLSYYGTTSISVRPYEKTSYSIKSLESGCGKQEFTNGQTVDISIRPGIRIEDDQKRQIICAGTKGRIKFRSSAALTDATQFTIQMDYGGESFRFPAARSGEFLEFEVPNRPQGYQGFNYKIIATNPSLESQSSYNIVVQTSPNLSFSAYNKYSYELPGRVQVGATLYGGSPYVIENMDGTTSQAEYDWFNPEFYLKESQEFKIKSISNACFKNSNPASATYTLVPTESPGIYMDPIKPAVCDTDSLEITFGTVGKFNPENVFAIQGYSNSSTYQTLSTAKQGGKYKIKLPAAQYGSTNGSIRVASTNPVVFSEQKSIRIQLPITQIYLYPEGKQETPAKYLANSNNTYHLQVQTSNSGPASSVVYTENGVEKTYIPSSFDSSPSIPILPSLGKTIEYVIKSVNNQCGTFLSGAKTFVSWVPYSIQFSDGNYYNTNYCVGGPIGVPFGITDGFSTNATFSLQIRKADATTFTTLASGETGRIINTTIPSSVTPGNYVMRIVSSDGAISPDQNIRIGAVPTATLAINPQSSSTVDFGNSVYMDISVTDGGSNLPSTVIFEDGSRITNYNEKSTRNIYVQKGGEYSIKSVSNACGYGTASGSVKVVVKPRLTASSNTYNICEGGSISVSYTLGGDVDLSDDYIRFELYDSGNNTTTVLDSTKATSGNRILKLPAVMKGNTYNIQVTARKYLQKYSLGTSITTKPDATLSGNTIINSGENTRLTIKSNKSSNGEIQYSLSDGTKGSFWGQIGYTTYITVAPKQTTTYTLSSLTNSCGEGTKSGAAMVEVNPVTERTVTVTSLANVAQYALCTGDTVTISYLAKGNFSSGNQMTVQISDTTGRNFRSITTIGNTSPIRAVLPTDLVSGKFYRVRIIASDPNTGSGAYEYPITASQKAKARFESDLVTYQENSNPRIVVLLEGGAPWTFEYGPDGSRFSRYTSNPIEKLELSQASPNQYYKLFSVRNNCGVGTIGTPSTVRVELVTGVEPTVIHATVAPNPAQETLKIIFKESGEKNIKLYDNKGSELIQKKSRMAEESMDIRHFPIGIYILRIDANGKKQTFKVIKN